jgi:hypothetical protein
MTESQDTNLGETPKFERWEGNLGVSPKFHPSKPNPLDRWEGNLGVSPKLTPLER